MVSDGARPSGAPRRAPELAHRRGRGASRLSTPLPAIDGCLDPHRRRAQTARIGDTNPGSLLGRGRHGRRRQAWRCRRLARPEVEIRD